MTQQAVALLTGATGFIGSALARALLRRGFAVRALTSRDPRDPALPPAIGWYGYGEQDIAEAVADVDFFFHFAVSYDRAAVSDEEIEQVNVQLPLRLIAALAARGRPVTCVLGDSFFRKFPADATAQPRYTASKARLAQALQQTYAHSVCRCAMLVIEQVYGPGDSMEKVFPSVTRTMLEGKTARLPLTEGTQSRDFIHRDDVVAAALATALSAWSGYTEVPCGSGTATPVRDAFIKLHALTGTAVELGFGDLPSNQRIDTSAADTAWLASRGWSAQKDLATGLAELVDDVRQRLAMQERAA